MNVMTLTVNELGQTIVEEVKRKSKITIFKYGMSQEEWSELSSFLCTELWVELHNKPELHNIRIVRRLINLRTVDYFRSKKRFNNQLPFSTFTCDKEESQFGVEFQYDWFMEDDVNVEKDYIMNQELTSFISTLSERQQQVLKLVVEGYQKQEICEKLGISINTPKNTMKKIKEKAISFGLESLLLNCEF